jgi:signal transduction histidine kinase
MNENQLPEKPNNKPADDHMQARINNLFAGQELPAHASLQEVEAMRNQIVELEEKLVKLSSKSQHQEVSDSKVDVADTFSSSTPEENTSKGISEKKSGFLARIFHAPTFSDLSKNRVASLQHKILLGLTFTSILTTIILLLTITAITTATSFIITLSSIALYAVGFVWLYQGRLQIVSWLLVAIFYGVIITTQTTGTFSQTTVILVTIVIAIAGVLLKPYQVIAVTVLTIVTSVFFATTNADTPITQTTIIFMAVLFGLEGLLLTFGAGAIEQSFVDVDNSTKALVNSNKQLQDLTLNLEQRISERTHDLELATEVGRAVSERVGDLTNLLIHSVDLIRSSYNLYYTQIYLIDAPGRNLVLRAGTGEVGKQLLQRGHRLAVSASSLNSRAASTQKPVLVNDTKKSDNFLPNPLLPNTRSELAVPLIVNEKVVGVLDMQSDTPETFSEANVTAFEVLAGQLAIAIQNSILFNQTEEARLQVEEQARRLTSTGWQDFLNAVDRSENLGYVLNQEEILPLTETQEKKFDSELVVPIQVAGESVGEVLLAGDANRQWSKEDAEIVQAAMQQVAQHIENLRLLAQAEKYRAEAEQVSRRLTSEGWQEFLRTRKELSDGYAYNNNQVQPLNNNGHEYEAALSYPLVVRDEPIGAVELEALPDVEADTKELVAAVVEKLSNHIENLRLLEQAEKKRLEMETVATVSSTASTVLNPDSLLQAVTDLTKTRFGLYHAHIYIADENWNTLLLASGAGDIGRKMVEEGHAISMDTEKSLVARAVREKQPVIVNDVQSQPDFLPNPLLPSTRAEMAIPMIVGEKVLGVFDVQSDQINGFSKEDANIYTTLASQVAIALQNARLYQEQAATVTQLRELDRLKSSFLANMSHELRTPLNSILGFTEVILEGLDGPITPNMDNDLKLINKNGQHLLHLINDVLDMAKIESGKMNLIIEKFNIQEIFEEVISITSPQASEKKLTLKIDTKSDQDVEVSADRTRIRQVMINLVNNALKFTEKGKITIRAVREENSVLISVKDTGIGIPPEHLEAIFSEFTQVDSSTTRKAGGTGLGLPISRKLIEMHGGKIWAESNGVDGEGSTFFIFMPIENRSAVSEPVTRKI